MSKPSLQHDRVEGEFTHAEEELSDGTAAPSTLGKASSEDKINDWQNIAVMLLSLYLR